MIKIFKFAIIVICLGTFNSCLDYEELRENPNNPNQVPPSLIFTDLTPGPVESFEGAYERMQYHVNIGTDNINEPSFISGFGGSFNYGTLRNVAKMIEEAEKVGAPEYAILGKFFRARTYIEMTRRMGDIPLSEAEQGADIPQPRYDSQKSIYIQALNWLDEANSELGDFIAANPTRLLEGDLYYNGNLKQWQKLINSYTLRILVSLSKKENDTDVNVKGRFQAIVSNGTKYPLMTSIADNAEFTFSNEDGFRQDYNPNCAVCREAEIYASTYIDLLKAKQDPRLMQVADPTRDAVEANPGDLAAVKADFDSYAGADISAEGIVNSAKKLDGDFSLPNFDRYWNFVGQPAVLISYWEQELNIAEAAHRGWIPNSPATHYNNGITASMEWYGVDSADIADYLSTNQPYIVGDAGLKRLLEQKYIAFAENSGQESFFMTRRTGVPTYVFSSFNDIDPGESYPIRWTYPGSEDVNNNENYRAALVSQFGAEVDDRDQIIWLLKD
ncbi:SusD/RagB family nutrient-binding outer membrane lipoprotein [Flavivirga spongiicola]|uniref:SusD/RagB family nutrient-binding outer membrane lipoprotein n=1 Tax=Flavivirga spongiicola TaxID=421621 RepID=A0ABU7XNW1_9FLAO|nr:SusD/RagB family nutrient-binding outer membrane lipoprotein [Flavivirga sp. MEBiC05379]MDO5977453.1 SusD/RagB family nutrient-binding outer membrane lipoprotein [Flavivirga sp. MEBiC05379]